MCLDRKTQNSSTIVFSGLETDCVGQIPKAFGLRCSAKILASFAVHPVTSLLRAALITSGADHLRRSVCVCVFVCLSVIFVILPKGIWALERV